MLPLLIFKYYKRGALLNTVQSIWGDFSSIPSQHAFIMLICMVNVNRIMKMGWVLRWTEKKLSFAQLTRWMEFCPRTTLPPWSADWWEWSGWTSPKSSRPARRAGWRLPSAVEMQCPPSTEGRLRVPPSVEFQLYNTSIIAFLSFHGVGGLNKSMGNRNFIWNNIIMSIIIILL
jgi:hypothetical protein